ncbi:MAG: GNAT family N-acetyltransferase [Candidatus Odinarchaeota archaeon]
MNPDKAHPQISVREMKAEDICSIIAIDQKISSSEKNGHRPKLWESEIKHFLDKPENICLVAEIKGEVIGFMIGAVHPWLFGIENGGWIEILGVDPSHTAKGVGMKMGERLLAEFKTRRTRIIYTVVDWRSGDLLEFFKALGMTKSGLITLMKEIKEE